MSNKFYGSSSLKKGHEPPQHKVVIQHGVITKNFLENQKAYADNAIRKLEEQRGAERVPDENELSEKQLLRLKVKVSQK